MNRVKQKPLSRRELHKNNKITNELTERITSKNNCVILASRTAIVKFKHGAHPCPHTRKIILSRKRTNQKRFLLRTFVRCGTSEHSLQQHYKSESTQERIEGREGRFPSKGLILALVGISQAMK